MNVILIISDTMRRDCLGCYGAPKWAEDFKTGIERVHTPNLDRFADMSYVFDNAYIASFPTVPTRNDLLTGRYTWTYKPWAPLGQEVTLQDSLNRAGVLTGLIVDTPHPFTPGYNYQRGFKTWEVIRGQEHDAWHADPEEIEWPCAKEKLRNPDGTVAQYLRNMSYRHWEEDYFPARTFREAARWLERNYQRDSFFLYVDTFDPHEPWDPPPYYVDLYDPGYEGERVIYPRYDTAQFLTKSELRHCRALYSGEVTLVDHWFGFLLNRIESLGLLRNSVVIFVSDHGFYLGEHNYMGKSLITDDYQQAIPLYPEVARVPLMMHVPQAGSATGKGKRVQSLAQTADLMPTICDLLGATIPEPVQAKSLAPLLHTTLKGRNPALRAVHDVVICSPTISFENLDVPHPTTRSSIYDGEWLLVYGSQVHHARDEETTQMVDSVLRRVRTLEQGPIKPALYHLPEDPECRKNQIDKERAVAKCLHSKYVSFLEEANVPERHLRFFREL